MHIGTKSVKNGTFIKNRWRYRLSDLWYTFFHPAVLWLEGAEDTYFHGEYSFSGVSDPWGGPLGPLFRFTPEILDFAPGLRFCLLTGRFLLKMFETFTRRPPGPP